MKVARYRACIAISMLIVTVFGCADLFLGWGELFNNIGDGFNTIGTCLSPLEPIDLNGIFAKVELVTWQDNSAEVTDAPQTDMQTFLLEQLGQDVQPIYYRVLRFYGLGPVTQGDIVEIEPIGSRLSHVYLYDDRWTLIPAGEAHDFNGQQRIQQIAIPRDNSALYLRLDLEFLSETGEAIARVTRKKAMEVPETQPQTVVLNFAGQTDIWFRSGWLVPTEIGPIDDPVARQAAVEAFRTIFTPFGLTVLTNEDPTPEQPHSVIHIGPADPPFDYYGYAEMIDARNVYPDDVAIVDANRPAIALARVLGPAVYGRALGTIAAHEMGHLLGLYHVADSDALMTGAQCQGTELDIERMLRRNFKWAPLIAASDGLTEWVIGYQEPVAYLQSILGPADAQ